jgi:carboxyl-terminal processing protease
MGRYMEEAIAIADELLIDKQLIFTKIKRKIQKTYATKRAVLKQESICVTE